MKRILQELRARASNTLNRDVPSWSLVLIVACLISIGPEAQEFQLHPPLAPTTDPFFEDEWALSPDGRYVAYVAGIEGHWVSLFARSLDPLGPSIDLHAGLEARSIRSDRTLFTADGEWIAYTAWDRIEEAVYAARLDGTSGPKRISPRRGSYFAIAETRPVPTVVYTGGWMYSRPIDASEPATLLDTFGGPEFQLSADGQYVAYGSRGKTVRIDGSSPPTQVADFWGLPLITPDSSRVLFRRLVGPDLGLFVVPIDGSLDPLMLSLHSGSQLDLFDIDPTSQIAIFRADKGDAMELFGVRLDGSTPPYTLSEPLAPNRAVRSARISRSGQHVLYTADEDVGNVLDLYLVPITGAPGLNLTNSLPITAGDVLTYRESPDGFKVLFRADRERPGTPELYRVALPSPVKLSGTLPPGATGVGSFQIEPDSNHVVFRADLRIAGQTELFRARIDGSGSPTLVSDPLIPDGDVRRFEISGDGALAAYGADPVEDEELELFAAPVSGGPALPLLDPLAPGRGTLGDIKGFTVSDEESTVVYVADALVDEEVRLFATDLPGGTSQVQLSSLPTESEGLEIAPNGEWALYRATAAGTVDVYSVPVSGGASMALSNAANGTSVDDYLITPDSLRVLYLAEEGSGGREQLYSRPIDGSLPAARLNGDLPSNSRVWEFLLDGTGSYVVYRAGQEASDILGLFSVPVDGSQQAIRLSLAGEETGHRFALTSPGDELLYWGLSSPGTRLSVVAVDGSSPPRTIAADPQAGISWIDTMPGYALASSSSPVPGVFAVPLLGGTPVGMGGFVTAHSKELHFQVSSSGDRVLIFEPNSVRSIRPDGTGAVTLYTSSGPLPGDRRIAATPDGRVLIYTGASPSQDSPGFFVVPTDGSRPARPIHSAPDLFGVEGITMAPDGFRAIVFEQLPGVSHRFALHSLPLHPGISHSFGLRRSRVVDVNFKLSSNGTFALYSSDRDSHQSIELYAVRLRVSLDSVAPASGPFEGGNVVTVHGSGFRPNAAVYFGTEPGTVVSAPSEFELRVRVPQADLIELPARRGLGVGGTTRTVDVSVSWNGETVRIPDAYTYEW